MKATVTGLAVLRAMVAADAQSIFAPPAKLTVSECADRHRVLTTDEGCAEPGPWRTNRVPYLREIMDSLADPLIERVVHMKASQIAGSQVGQNLILHRMLYDPCPIIICWPTLDLLKNWSVVKLEAMIRTTPELQDRVFDSGARRDQHNTMTRKTFPGGALIGVHAKSSAMLRAWTAPVGIVEELDECDAHIDQGDVLERLERAMRTFFDAGEAKLFIVSTPTIAGYSRIEKLYDASDQRRYFVPCPYCNGAQRIRWRDDDGSYRMVCERGEGGQLMPETARYRCEHCTRLIEQHWRDSMLAVGHWQPAHPGRKIRGYHNWSGESPFVSWARIVAKFLELRASSDTLKTFMNLWLGEAFSETGVKIEPHVLQARAEPYPIDNATGEILVPTGVGLLTAYVDVQGDRLEVVVWGWGAGEEGWHIAWELLEGDPGRAEVWEKLDQYLGQTWKHEHGAQLRLVSIPIDAGYQSEEVHRYCESRKHRFPVFPSIGRDGFNRKLIEAPGGATGPRPAKWRRSHKQQESRSWILGVDTAKSMVHSRLQITAAGPGYLHTPTSLDRAAYEHLTSEVIKPVYRDGRPMRKWVKIEGRANEFLDGTVGCLCALAKLGAPVLQKLAEYAQLAATPPDQTPATTPAPRPGRRILSRGVLE